MTAASLLTIFGATGDLAQRMLLPSLFGQQRDGLLPPGMRILGTARSDLDDAAFRALVAEAVHAQVPATERDSAALEALLARIDYLPAALDDADDLARLGDAIAARRQGDVVYHLSTAPQWYAPVCAALGARGLGGDGTRVLLEKPIGHDLPSAIAINDDVARVFDEDRVFRVDHYLGKEGVQNLIALRFGNALFEPLWNARHIEQVQITVGETVGVEGRGDYYDDSGALRDMLQNHLLQLCAGWRGAASQFEPTALRTRNEGAAFAATDRCQTLRPTRRRQYAAGASGAGRCGYRGPGPCQRQRKLVAMRQVENWRWKGVPFYLRTGKRLPRRSTEIYIQFRDVPHSIFDHGNTRLEPNALVIELQPEERIALRLMTKTPGLDRAGLQMSQVGLDLDMQEEFAALRRARPTNSCTGAIGNGTLFVRAMKPRPLAWGCDPRGSHAGCARRIRRHWVPGLAGPAERHGHAWSDEGAAMA